MNSIQIMNILNNNMMMKYITYTLIQNPLMMNQMMNILNSLYYNQMLMIEIKNLMNQEINMMNWKNMVNPMMGNLGLNNKFDELKQNNKITIIFKKKIDIDIKTFPIDCNESDKVSFVIQKYRDTYNDYEKKEKFIYNAKPLKPSLTVAEESLKHNSVIHIVDTHSILGG